MISLRKPGYDRPGAADPVSLPYRRERAYLVLALALLVGISLYLIEVQRERTWRSAEDGVLNVALGLQTTSTRTLEHSLFSLRRVGAALARGPAPSREQTLAALRDAIALDPVTAFLGIASAADGSVTLVDRTGVEAPPEIAAVIVGIAPAAHDTEPALRPLVRLPHDEEAYLPVALALPGTAGRRSAAFALVAAHGLTAGSDSMRLIPDGWATWIMPDGTRLLAYSEERGQMEVNSPRLPPSIMRLQMDNFGVFSAFGPVDGLPYLVGYSRSATLPFIVGVTAPRSALYWEWARRALAPAIVLLAGAAAVLIFWSRLHAALLRQQAYDRQREHMLREVQDLAGRLLRLQDDERRHIGRELHDSTVQLLAVLEFNLDRMAASESRMVPAAPIMLQECIELARRCSEELRTTSYLLHPPLLDELGLLSALRWLADGLRQRSDIRVELQLPETMERLPPDLELALFRVAQEALSNVHRHSRSPKVVIRLRASGETVTLEVEDAGRGILDDVSPGATPGIPSSGVGLASMLMRMRQLGGTLTIETSEHGTCVRAHLPLARKLAAAPVAAPSPGQSPIPVAVRSPIPV